MPMLRRAQHVDVSTPTVGRRVTGGAASVAVLAVVALCAAFLAAVTPLSPAVAVTSRAPVVVSLGFDDSTADHIQPSTILEQHGMKGTFYVNSGRVGQIGNLTWPQVRGIADAGHEIGGHTVSHPNLATLSADEQARQICDDRATLLGQGFAVRTLAYPFGANDASSRDAAASCGYNSARTVGGIVSPGTCSGCAYAEAVPPSSTSLYRTRTPDSVKTSTSLTDMEGFVLQAEQNGGGWVNLVMHHICSGSSCDAYSVAASQLDAFLTWLEARESGGTTVRTAGDVIGGAVAPAVDGPQPAPAVSPENLFSNASFENDSNNDGTADCWQHGGYGTNSYSWSRTTSARSGAKAERVSVSSFTTGDRRLVSAQDLGACAPATVTGHSYRFTGWYQTSGKTQVVAYYRTSGGGWVYWTQGPVLAKASDWVSTTWTTPAAPAEARAISVGLSLRSSGTLTSDDFSLRDTDATPPAVTLAGPADGSTVRGAVNLSATASDASGVATVNFIVDDNIVCADTTAPYTCAWDTTSSPDHVAAVVARAVDTAGNIGTSTTYNYTVGNSVPADTAAPVVTLTAPVDGGTVSGMSSLQASAIDNVGVDAVYFLVDGVTVGQSTTSPYAATWDTTTVADGTHVVSAKAVDRAGNETTSASVSVTVANATPTPTPTPPTPTPTSASPTPTGATNLLQNGSMELDANGDRVADCWQHGGFGTNTYTWSRSATAHSGTAAERITVSSLTSGDRRLISPQNNVACQPALTTGHRYTFTGWYQTDAKVQVVAYYLSAAGAWTYWTQSSVLPVSSTWSTVSWTTPSAPSGATAISIGWSIRSPGTTTMDDASLVDIGP